MTANTVRDTDNNGRESGSASASGMSFCTNDNQTVQPTRNTSVSSLFSDLSVKTDAQSLQNKPSKSIDVEPRFSLQLQHATPLTGEASANIPDPLDLIIALNHDSTFETFFSNLTDIFSTYFGAQRLSLVVPTDPTDIANVPWGLRALWDKSRCLVSTPKSPGFESCTDRSVHIDRLATDRPAHLDENDDQWDTDDEERKPETANRRPLFGRQPSFGDKLTKRISKNFTSKIPAPLTVNSQDEELSGTFITQSDSTSPFSTLIFDELRTLEWEKDALIDAEGVSNVLDIDHMVVLQRKYLKPMNEEASYIDRDQILYSPWACSPVPSPAVKEYTQPPFFSKTHSTDEMRAAFASNTGFGNHLGPLDSIGFEDTYTLIHLLLVVPSASNFSCAQKSPFESSPKLCERNPPVAILSFLSSLIPFPANVREVIDKITPHISAAFLQTRSYSALVKKLDQLKTAENRFKGRSRSPISPFLTSFPQTRSYASRRRKNGHARKKTNESAYLNSLDARDQSNNALNKLNLSEGKVYYSSLKDDKAVGLGEVEIPIETPRRRFSLKRRKSGWRSMYLRPLRSFGARVPNFMTERRPSATDDNLLSHKLLLPETQRSNESDNPTFEMVNPSNKLLRTIIDAIPVHVFTAEPVAGRITWASNRTLTFRGLTASEFCHDPLQSIHPDDQDDYSDAWTEALKKNMPLGHMFRVRRFDGRYRALFLRAVPLLDDRGSVAHWFCTMMDIHNKHQSEMAAIQLAQETAWEQKYKILAESTPIIVFTYTAEKGITYMNQKWIDYTGLSTDEAMGFQYLSAIHPDDRAKSLLTVESMDHAKSGDVKVLPKGSSFRVELRIRNKDGEYRWNLTTFSCSGDVGSAESLWFGTSTDIQDQKLIQQKLMEAKDAAQRTIESKSTFLSNMSHEIRTPLIGISGMVSFLLDTPLSEEQLDYCHTISSSSEALLMVINDILDLSKVESGKMTLQYNWFFVRQLVEEVNELLSSMAISKNLELNNTIDNNVPMWVKGDRVRLRQVILNLIGNAIKFTDLGEIYTYCSVGSVSEDKKSMLLQVEVHDTGRGFTSEDAAKRMFKPYSQIGNNLPSVSSVPGVMPPGGDSTAGTSGTGLGLVISRQLIELHGGHLTCEGVKGQGSVFRFTARVKLPTEEDKPTPDELQKHEQSSNNTDIRINQVNEEKSLAILVVCPWKYTCKSIEHHIRATLAEPDKCEIVCVDGFQGLSQVLKDSEKSHKRWTHIVLNVNDVDDVCEMLKYLANVPTATDSHLLVLTSPTQRSALLKMQGDKLPDGRPITYLAKPLKPSRYSVVFDPNRKREESRDVKMQKAHQSVMTHRTVFDELKNFAFGHHYRILLAEDNLVNQKVMTKFLGRAGITCSVASDGEACTQQYFASESDFDMILCDLDMPRKDGFQVCKEIRCYEKEKGLQPVPIVALSAYVMSDVSAKCDEAGFDRYISKPVEFEVLKDAIIEGLEKPRGPEKPGRG